MADPTPYQRSYSFTNYQADTPDRPLPGNRVDVELDNIAENSRILTETVNAGFKVDANLEDIVKVGDEIEKVVFVADNMPDVRAAAGVAPYVQQAIALFLGAFPEDPTEGANGDPLTIGATYYNTVISQSFVWTGSAWVPVAQVSVGGVLQGSLIVADGETTFTIGDYVSVTVARNGRVLRPGIDYTTASPDITVPLASNDDEITWFGILKGSITDAATFVRQTILTTTADRYSTNTDGQPLNLTPSNHILFGASPFAVLTYGVDYTVDSGDLVFSFTPTSGELYHVFSMPRFTNTEAQVIITEIEGRVAADADRAEVAANRADAATPFSNYAAALAAAPSLPGQLQRISWISGSREVAAIRLPGGPLLGGGWAPAGDATPEHFADNAVPGVTDMGAAIQAAFNYAFVAPNCRSVVLQGPYASSIALSPVAAQGANPGNFDMPFSMIFKDARITFTGTGNGARTAFSIYNNTDQRSVRYGTIQGRLTVLNAGDWRDGIEMQACNWWSVQGALQAGELLVTPTGASGGFTRNGIRYTANNGKGGLWNKWGQAIAFGGQVPLFVGPIANANQWDHVFAAFGTDGMIYNGGDRNTFTHMSAEFNEPGSIRYIFQNAGVATVVSHMEFEKVSATTLAGTSFIASIWCTGGSLVASAEFYALSTAPFYVVEPGAIMDLTWINDVSSFKRIERICVPPTWTPSLALRKAPTRKTLSPAIGVNGVYSAYQTVISYANSFSLLPMGVVLTNNTDQPVTANVATRSEGGTVTLAASVTIAVGATETVDGALLAAASIDGVMIDAIQVRARISGPSYTGQLAVVAVAMPL